MFALLDVTKTGTSPVGFDSNRYQRTRFFSGRSRGFHRLLKRSAIGNHVIGGKGQHRCRVVARRDPASAERDRRRCIAFGWFGDDILFRESLEQIANGFFLLNVGEDESSLQRNKTFEARDRFFQQSPRRLSGQKRSPLPPARMSA